MSSPLPAIANSSRSSTVIDDNTRPSTPAAISQVAQKGSFEVRFDDDDPAKPQNWSRAKRWYLTLAAGLLVLNATFSSSAPSGVVPQLLEQFHMSREVGILTISLFVAGYIVGPLAWGPLSEQYGRRPMFLISFLFYTGFQVGCALSQNTASILIFRFLGGTFAACPLTNSGGLISDIWDAKTRGKALAVFTLAPFAGPALGPTVAGWIAVAGVSWRILFWVLTGFAGFCGLICLFTMPETYAPILLKHKAQRLRKETGDDRYYAPIELDVKTFTQRLETIIARPFKMLIQEPMLLAITIYMSFVYGCLYLLFEAYPIVFTQGHHFNAGISGLIFLPIPVGGALAVTGYLLIFNPRYEKAVDKYAPNPVPPEFRLEMAMFAAPLFMVSFFWFGWSSPSHVSFWAPAIAGGLLGFSISWIFLPLFNYMIDTYLFAAASALAANTVVRSTFGAVFPLFATQMYEALGAPWASSLLGFIALLMMPIPFILIKFGPRLRKMSKFAPTLPAVKHTAESKLETA